MNLRPPALRPSRRHRAVRALGLATALIGVSAGSALSADEFTIKLPASVQIETKERPGPNDPDRCWVYAFARVPHIRLAKGYRVAVDDTSSFNRDAIYNGPPFPDDDFRYGDDWPVPPDFHQFALSGGSTGQGCAQAILMVEGRWVIVSARVSMKQKFSDRYKEPFEECLRRAPKPRRLAEPIVVGKPGEPIGVQRVGKQGKVTVTEDEAVLDWENTVKPEWWGDGEAPMLIKTDANAIARVVDGDGRGIIIGPNMTVRITPGEPFQVVKQGKGSFDSLSGVRPITDDVDTPKCTIATQ